VIALVWCTRAFCALTGAGDIAFVGFNTDNTGDFSFVLLVDVNIGDDISFTDNEWSGSTFSTDEGEITWTSNSSLPAGTVVSVSDLQGTPSVSDGSLSWLVVVDLRNSDEALFAYIGEFSNPTAFLSAISNDGDAGFTTLTGTGLTLGSTAIDFGGTGSTDHDILAYNGIRSGAASFAAYLTMVNNPANWVTQNGIGTASDGSPPDIPFDSTPFSITQPERIFENGFE